MTHNFAALVNFNSVRTTKTTNSIPVPSSVSDNSVNIIWVGQRTVYRRRYVSAKSRTHSVTNILTDFFFLLLFIWTSLVARNLLMLPNLVYKCKRKRKYNRINTRYIYTSINTIFQDIKFNLAIYTCNLPRLTFL